MPRRSKRKQNRKKNQKQNSTRKIKYNLEKQNLTEKSADLSVGQPHLKNSFSDLPRLNGPAPQISKENSYQNKSLQFEFESDSDPDVFYEFQSNLDVSRAKSDSALNKIKKYIIELKSLNNDLISRECFDIEKNKVHTSIDSCRNTLTESISTTQTVDSCDLKFLSKQKSNSVIQCDMSSYVPPRDALLSLNSVQGLQNKEIRLKDIKTISNIQSGTRSGETSNPKAEKSFENFNQQVMMMKLSDEALELGITAIPPKRLNSSSNILISNSVCPKKSFSGLETIPDKIINHSGTVTPEEEHKIYLEKTKNEKHLLNCSILAEEPQCRSTPILKTSKSKEQWKSPTEGISTDCVDATIEEEFHTCLKEFILEEDTPESEICLGQYVSCRDIRNMSKEILKIFPPEGSNSQGRLVSSTSLRNVSIQCEILKTDPQEANDGRLGEEKKEKKVDLDLSVTEANQQQSQASFKTFKRLFTRVSIHKFFHVLSILPMDKILEFFCLTFSIPLIETMAISISVTKVMNILSTITLVPNLNEKLKNYKSKAVDCLRERWTNFTEVFVKYRTIEIDATKESHVCLCDIQKMTDLEKRLKNLENELTKFQYVDAEIEKLKEIAKNLQQAPVHAKTSPEAEVAAPPPPPPPPPPLPPPFPAGKLGNPLPKGKKPQKPQDSVSRPSITVEDLQKVILRKVTTNERQAPETKKGPVVSLEMLRSVKLRSSARKKTPTCSPTRTPTSRERIRRIKSPFRSGNRSRDRKSRYPNIPLSEILAMDDSYQLYDQKTAETHKMDSSICY